MNIFNRFRFDRIMVCSSTFLALPVYRGWVVEVGVVRAWRHTRAADVAGRNGLLVPVTWQEATPTRPCCGRSQVTWRRRRDRHLQLLQPAVLQHSAQKNKATSKTHETTKIHCQTPFLNLVINNPLHLKYVATLPCNVSLVACFVDINVSHGSVATRAR